MVVWIIRIVDALMWVSTVGSSIAPGTGATPPTAAKEGAAMARVEAKTIERIAFFTKISSGRALDCCPLPRGYPENGNF